MSPMGKCLMGICRHGYMSHGYMSPNLHALLHTLAHLGLALGGLVGVC